ncbi:peroxin 8 [Hypoxylon fuscum]|nr:peroxin 8 [Hypoxylon fuscum]
MPTDRLLAAVLRAYRDAPNPAERDKIFATTTTLLTRLNNPLNLTLLTSQFLTARSIWEFPDGLRTCLRVMSIYNTATIHVLKNELDRKTLPARQEPVSSSISLQKWARAIVNGADEKSRRWKHVLVLTGTLMGMKGDDSNLSSQSFRPILEKAVVIAANLALEDQVHTGKLGRATVVLALTYAFPLLSSSAKELINGNLLLPATIEAMLGEEGFQYGEFVSSISNDVTHIIPGQRMMWHVNSPSVVWLQKLESLPLTLNMGPLSRLASFAVQHAVDSMFVLQAQEELLKFTAVLMDRWLHCPLSAVDLTVEATALTPDTLQGGHYAMLWQGFKKMLYAVVATLQPMIERVHLDPSLRTGNIPPSLASKTLQILRNLSFISTRQGASSFQVYTFTYLCAIDTITTYPDACVSLLQSVLPVLPQTGNMVPSPIHQANALFYMNTAEHLPLSLSTPECETFILNPATAYLSPTTSWLSSPANNPPSALTRELFEAAHSAVLSVLSWPQHSVIAASLIPFYIDAVLSSFPSRISPRQFRLAFRTMMRITSPPHPISADHPELSETMLEMLRFRAVEGGASTAPLLPLDEQTPTTPATASRVEGPVGHVSEQTALVLALLDALPFLPLAAVEEWLTRAAEAMNGIADERMRDTARRRFWDMLVSGEMDVERAAVGVAWWGTNGGREMVLFSHPRRGPDAGFLMSGALAPPPGVQSRVTSML